MRARTLHVDALQLVHSQHLTTTALLDSALLILGWEGNLSRLNLGEAASLAVDLRSGKVKGLEVDYVY